MTTRFMLDTNVLIEILRRPSAALRSRVAAEGGRLAVSTVTASELHHGAERSSAPAEARAAVEAALALVEVLPYDEPAATHTGEIRAVLARAGTPIGAYDVMIAGHARSAALTVVTHDGDFTRVPGLVVEDWGE